MDAYVLVGGRSRRMGRDKSGLFLDDIVAAARPVFDRVIAVQRADGEESIDTIFESPHDDEAPIFGVARALADAQRRCVILAVDYPLITAAFLSFLRDRTISSQAPLVVPLWDGHPQLLCAGYDPRLLPLIGTRIAARRYDLRTLAEEAGAELIAEDELRERFGGEPLMNVNTPDDLQLARRSR
jgi:molybdopterin-guanine dinucleotide biosynthesis protein A